MKNIYRILAFAVSALAMLSCTLEREDYTQITPDSFFKTETDLVLAVNNLYSPWASVYDADGRYGYSIFSDMTTDNLFCNWGWEWDTFHYHQWKNQTGINPQAWRIFNRYNYLSTARNTIRRIEAAPVKDDVKQQYIGEARALRGWMALVIYDILGPVPVASDEVLDDPETFVYLPRLSEEEWDAMMEDDLLTAIEYLPEQPKVRGRMSKGSARMILLKYYMIKGYFDKAEQIARDLYAMEGIYSLQPNYQYVFSKEGIGNNEIILQIPANEASSSTCNMLVMECLPTDYPWAEKADAGWGGYFMPWDFYDTFDPADKRLGSLKDHYINKSGVEVTRNDMNGAVILKYGLDPDMKGPNCTIDRIIFRYSDVLLMLAECIARNNNRPTEEAVALVNRVRNRAGLADLSGAAATQYDAFNEALLLERGQEFFLEGFRRQDLIRFGKYIEYANARIDAINAKANKGYFNVDESHNRVFIPDSFITESKDAIKQNPGY